MKWFRMYNEALDDPKVQSLNGNDFKAALIAAMNGADNAFSKHIVGPFIRPLAHEWREIRARIFARDDYTCGYCGARGVQLECDHVMPVALGGDHSDDNLLTACKPCNRAKAAKPPEAWKLMREAI